MKALTRRDFAEWCEARGLESVDREWPYYRGAERYSFLVKLPGRPSQVLALARCCFPFSDNDGSFQGALVWLRDWGIWNEADEEMGKRVIVQMRAGYGESRALADAQAIFFQRRNSLTPKRSGRGR
jgi:hypothetical protein